MPSEENRSQEVREAPEQNRAAELAELEHMRRSSKKMKKKVLLVIGGVLLTMLLIFGVIRLLETLGKKPAGIPDGTYKFYSPYEGDIMQNREYLGLNRAVCYCANPNGMGLTESIHAENRGQFSADVLYLHDWIQTIIAGDADAHNACLNATYRKDNELKTSFSPQMLYNILITYQESVTEADGDRLVTYRLEYMILRNDGTYRRDIGSRMSRPQDITLRVTKGGEISIERIVTRYSTVKGA